MSRLPVPIGNINRRLPEAGRIRTGVKTGKAMKALTEFRFTSHDRAALDQVAALYGGVVQPWSDPKAAPGQFELLTTATEIRVVLPPDPLAGTPIYERWGGGGCDRRCDGLSCTTTVQGPDGPEPAEVPCMCVAQGEMSCDVKVRLNVLLPEVRFVGTWRLESKSWNAAQELPGMVDMIQLLQGQGLAHATLTLQPRRSVSGGKTKNFVIPVLGIPASLEQLAAGGSRLQSLGTGDGGPSPAAALGAGDRSEGESPGVTSLGSGDRDAVPSAPSDPHPPDPDDEIADAEIVDEDGQIVDPAEEPSPPSAAPPASAGSNESVKATRSQMSRIHAGLSGRIDDRAERRRWASEVLGRPVESFSTVTKDEAGRLIDWMEEHW